MKGEVDLVRYTCMNIMFLAAIPWVALIWYFARGRRTNFIIMFVMLAYIITFLPLLTNYFLTHH